MDYVEWAMVLVPVIIVAGFLLKGLRLINDDEVGILIKKMFGKKMPQGQVVAKDNEIGVQADILQPGLYWRIPIIWRIEKQKWTEILPSEVGVVESIDGIPIPKGRLLGDETDCNHFQDAKKFLNSLGHKGPQVSILMPGTYRINTYAYKVVKAKVIEIPAEKIGVVIALDGKALPSKFIVAPKPEISIKDHQFFQNGQAFIDSTGYRGPQLDTLQPGRYYINPLLFKVDIYDQADVPPGYVAVLRSNVGAELVKGEGSPIPTVSNVGPPEITKPLKAIEQPIHDDTEVLLILDRDMRGIYKEPIAPGKYNINTLAFTAYLVPTSAVTIDWASEVQRGTIHTTPLMTKSSVIKTSSEAYDEVSDKASEFFKFSQLRVTSMDGFQLEVDVRLIIRIVPQNAAWVIARFGSVKNLIEQIVHPLIDSSFRNKAGEENAINFMNSRIKLQTEALEKARNEFGQYHVEALNILIAYIKIPDNLLETQTRREIAVQQKAQYEQEALAQKMRIDVQAKAATADKQPDVIAAQLAVNIEENRANAKRELAGGDRDYLMMVADGKAYEQREVGKGIADAYNAQAQVIGPAATASIKMMTEVGLNKVQIVPQILVGGGGIGGQEGTGALWNLFSVWMAESIQENLNKQKQGSQESPPKETKPTPLYEPMKKEMPKEVPKKDLKETTK